MVVPARYRALRQRPRLLAVAAVTVGLLVVWPAVDWWLRATEVAPEFFFWDFGAYNGGVSRWLEGGSIYVSHPTENGGVSYHGSYLYPPITLLVFLPFIWLAPSVKAAGAAWAVVTVAILWVALQALVAELGYRLRWYERLLLGWLMVGFQPLLLTAKMGQTAALLTASLALAYVGLSRQRATGAAWGQVAGAATAAVGVFKLAYAPVGTHLLVDRTRLLAAVGTGLGLVAASVAIFGLDVHAQYIAVLQWGIENGADSRSPALWGEPYLRPLVWMPATTLVRVLASAVIAVVAALGTDEDAVYAVGLAAFPLLTPLGYTYYLVVLLPAALVMLASEWRRDGHPALAVLPIALAGLHAYGLKFIVDVIPMYLPAFSQLRPAYGLFQPGLWAATILAGLAFVRVLQSVDLDPARDRLEALA